MLRALIAAALLTGAAVHFLDAPPDAALGYSLVACLILWFAWPLARRLTRPALRTRRRRTPRRGRGTPATPAPALTQINHHHHYYGPVAVPPAAAPQPDPMLLGLPRRGRQQMAHDAIYNTIDIDDV